MGIGVRGDIYIYIYMGGCQIAPLGLIDKSCRFLGGITSVLAPRVLALSASALLLAPRASRECALIGPQLGGAGPRTRIRD